MKNVGIVLIAIGILMMVITGFNVVTREKVVDIGNFEIKGDVKRRVQWTPIIGGVVLAAGVAIVLFGRKRI